MKKLNIFIVDDHALFRRGLASVLSGSPQVDNIWEASNGFEFLHLLEKYQPQVVLMDISMPEMEGHEATVKALEKYPDLKVIALSMHNDVEHYKLMIDAGVMGFLSKDANLDDVLRAIYTVAEGNKIFSQELLYDVVKKWNSGQTNADILTPREKEVLQLISSGLSNHEIADKLFLSKRTVDKHRENILSKTQTKNTADLIMYAIKNSLI